MGSSTLQFCFSVYAAAEETFYVSVEEVLELLGRIIKVTLFLFVGALCRTLTRS